ncbi:MAG: hypothetical protein JNM84_19815 [Planctomycetes bacterium]|nr:hypothetical protein [Planctomycetota bacterium]
MGDWRSLKVGDRIRFRRLPSEWQQPGFVVPSETVELYHRLIQCRRSFRVRWIQHGRPMIRAGFRGANGRIQWECLAVDDDA